MRDCTAIQRLLALRPDEWSEQEREQVAAHLDGCDACAQVARAYATQETLLGDFEPSNRARPSWSSVQSRIERRKRGQAMSARVHVVLRVMAAVAAMVALVFVLNVLFRDASQSGEMVPAAGSTAIVVVQATATLPPPPTFTPAPPTATPFSEVLLRPDLGPVFEGQIQLLTDKLYVTIWLTGTEMYSKVNVSALSPSAWLGFSLTWQVAAPETDWTAFVHVVDDYGHLLAQADTPIDWPQKACVDQDQPVPCSLETEHSMRLPADITPGIYTMLVGLYDPDSSMRASVNGGPATEAILGVLTVEASPTPTVVATATVPATVTLELPQIAHMPLGVEAGSALDPQQVASAVQDLGVTWVKRELRWAEVAPERGVYEWAALDAWVDACEAADLKLLLTVYGSPGWAQKDTAYTWGTPEEIEDWGAFMAALAERYQGRVGAYEIWHEQNVAYTEDKSLLDAQIYVRLLGVAYHTIKSVDPAAIVISGAPQPLGLVEGDWAVNHILYLEQMIEAGLVHFCDAVGVQADGYGNPPDVLYEGHDPDPARPFDDHPSFYYRHVLEDSHQVLADAGYGYVPLWVTGAGWATADGLGTSTPHGMLYAEGVDEDMQAEYLVGAYQWTKEWGHTGALFIRYLNVSPVRSDLGMFYSILYPDWLPRPAYTALQEMIQQQ